MFKILRRLAFVTSIAAALPLLVPSFAHAQLRDFEGKVDSVNEKQIIVDNRKGDGALIRDASRTLGRPDNVSDRKGVRIGPPEIESLIGYSEDFSWSSPG